MNLCYPPLLMQIYINTGTAEDYRLLEQMNKVTLNKYLEMKQIAGNIDKAVKDLYAKCMYTIECIVIVKLQK